MPLAVVKGVSREFSAICQNIVPPRELGADTRQKTGAANYLHIPCNVEVFGGRNEGEIQISKVVKDGSAARQTPRKPAPLTCKKLGTALRKGILIFAYDNGALILPQVQNNGFIIHRVEKDFFCGKVNVGVRGMADIKLKIFNHNPSFWQFYINILL